MNKNGLGRHFLVDYFDCDAALLAKVEQVEKIILEGARLAKATIVQELFHQFNPHGISGVVVIAESHIAIHTWPEYRTASVDIFTCSEEIDIESLLGFLKKSFGAQSESITELRRGKKPD